VEEGRQNSINTPADHGGLAPLPLIMRGTAKFALSETGETTGGS
jgi:hypothetical protein